MTDIDNNNLVPVLLIVGGLLFVLLALSKRIAVIEISSSFRRLAAVLGLLLLFGGVGLYGFMILLNTLASLGQSSRPEANLPTPAPTDTSSPVQTMPMPTPSAENAIGVIEGRVEAVNGNVIIIYGIEIEITSDDPMLGVIQVGDVIRIEGNFGWEDTAIVVQEVTTVALLSSATPLATSASPSTLTTEGTPPAEITVVATEEALTATDVGSFLTSTTNLPATVSTPNTAFTPPLTNTLFPTSTVLQDNVETYFHDEFSRERLSLANWQTHGIEPVLRNDRLIFEGVNRWGDSIARSGIIENEGVLLLFRYATGEMEMYLESGEFGESDYRRWGFVRYGSEWEAGSIAGNDHTVYESVRLRVAEWHYLLLRVGHDGHFYTQVWEADDPSGFRVNLLTAPAGGNWEKGPWRFVLQVHSGTLELEFYEDLHFPEDYQSLAVPPQLTPPG
jgi:hypothetical protein